jgi:UDP-N-acetyl-D-glucosamine dehydrogenase
MRDRGMEPQILDAAIANHEHRAGELAQRIERGWGSLRGKRVLLLGVTYKPDVADTRRSPARALVEVLEESGATVAFADPYVADFAGRQSIDLGVASPGEYDLAVMVTRHRAFIIEELRRAGWLVFDPATDRAPTRAGSR